MKVLTDHTVKTKPTVPPCPAGSHPALELADHLPRYGYC
jgi:hypothetical protein